MQIIRKDEVFHGLLYDMLFLFCFEPDQDIFMDLMIDELKRENREAQFALAARDERLNDAASKVREMIEQNTILSSKLQRAISKEERTR